MIKSFIGETFGAEPKDYAVYYFMLNHYLTESAKEKNKLRGY